MDDKTKQTFEQTGEWGKEFMEAYELILGAAVSSCPYHTKRSKDKTVPNDSHLAHQKTEKSHNSL